MAMGQNWETLVEHENEQNGPQPHVGDGSFQLRKQNAFSGCLEAGGYLKRLSLSLSLWNSHGHGKPSLCGGT